MNDQLIESSDESVGAVLSYGCDDRWYLFDEPTDSPVSILAAFLMCVNGLEPGEA
jgi:hypothetical protein